jgi:glycosyltransferase involved in cell wall biosynthesis
MPVLVASTAYPRPPIDGDKVRWSNLLHELAALTSMDGVFGFIPSMEARDPGFDKRFGHLEVVPTPNVEVAIRAGLLELRRQPSAFGRRATPRWRRAVVTAVNRERPSAILLLGTSAGYVTPLRGPTWLDLVDVRSRVRTLSGDRIVDPRVLRAELALTRRHHVILASESDRHFLVQHGADSSRLTIIPNGADPRLSELASHPDSNILLFVGSLRYRPNLEGLQWFLRGCWPKVRNGNPNAILRIVGYRADRIAPSDHVEIYADVPDVRPHYAVASVAIAPLLEARGVQNKALEAMAAGLPVVCTSPVSRGFISEEPAWEVADHPDGFANACLALLADPRRRADLGERGRRYVRAHHDWAASAALARDALQSALA